MLSLKCFPRYKTRCWTLRKSSLPSGFAPAMGSPRTYPISVPSGSVNVTWLHVEEVLGSSALASSA